MSDRFKEVMDKHLIDVCCIQETRYVGEEDIKVEGYCGVFKHFMLNIAK